MYFMNMIYLALLTLSDLCSAIDMIDSVAMPFHIREFRNECFLLTRENASLHIKKCIVMGL